LVNESIAAALKWTRSELMTSELEDIALRLFEQRGFSHVTVEEIAAAAGISVRTFYRYFPSKDLLLQVDIDRRGAAVRTALAARPVEEPLLTSLRVALTEAMGAEDPELLRRWITVMSSNPDLIRGVLGGIQMKIHGVIAEFVASRLDLADDAFTATIMAGAVGGAVQAALRHWSVTGGDLAATIAQSLEALERLSNDPTTVAEIRAPSGHDD
jgi:AcrR family transcriptional regulator